MNSHLQVQSFIQSKIFFVSLNVKLVGGHACISCSQKLGGHWYFLLMLPEQEKKEYLDFWRDCHLFFCFEECNTTWPKLAFFGPWLSYLEKQNHSTAFVLTNQHNVNYELQIFTMSCPQTICRQRIICWLHFWIMNTLEDFAACSLTNCGYDDWNQGKIHGRN